MSMAPKFLLKALSPKVVAKAAAAFDRAMTIVVGACWAGAILMVGFALYTIHLSVTSKRAAEQALSTEPNLPNIKRIGLDPHEAQVVIDKLQKRYPGLTFSFRSNLSITANDGGKFHDWLAALGYVDTISPQYNWTISDFCVGKCVGHDLMRAVLTGQKVSFEAPKLDSKN